MLKAIRNRIAKFFVIDLNGWKTALAWVLLQIPFLVENPLLMTAILDVAAEPTNPAKIGALVLQLLMLIGVGHHVAKNLGGDPK